MQHGAVECSSPHSPALGNLAWLPDFKAFLVLLGHVSKHFPATLITISSLLCFMDKLSHFQAIIFTHSKAGGCRACPPCLSEEQNDEVCRGASSFLQFAPSKK